MVPGGGVGAQLPSDQGSWEEQEGLIVPVPETSVPLLGGDPLPGGSSGFPHKMPLNACARMGLGERERLLFTQRSPQKQKGTHETMGDRLVSKILSQTRISGIGEVERPPGSFLKRRGRDSNPRQKLPPVTP